MYLLITILIVIVSILLTLVVLVQNSKGGGLAANFAAAGNQTFGVRQTADFLEKATWTLAIAILVLCLAATMFVPSGTIQSRSAVQERLENVQSVPGQPEFPATQGQGQGQEQPQQQQPQQ